jgi:hypothetical protein
MGISITEAAASEIQRVMQEQNRPELKYVRVGVVGGGCSGFQYSFDFTNSYDETADMLVEQHEPLLTSTRGSKNVASRSTTRMPSSPAVAAAASLHKQTAANLTGTVPHPDGTARWRASGYGD